MRVVLCDDHRMFVDALAVVLQARGYQVVACTTTPAAAVEAVRRQPVDVCLLDLQFPEGSGVTAIGEIRSVSPNTRVVVLTGFTDAGLLNRALLAGASGVAVKSEDVDAIIHVLERVHRGELAVQGPAVRAIGLLAARGHGRRAVQLTRREQQVLERLVQGEATKTLARNLGLGYSTIRTYIQNILSKLGVHSKLEAVALAVREGLVPPPADPPTEGPRGAPSG